MYWNTTKWNMGKIFLFLPMSNHTMKWSTYAHRNSRDQWYNIAQNNQLWEMNCTSGSRALWGISGQWDPDQPVNLLWVLYIEINIFLYLSTETYIKGTSTVYPQHMFSLINKTSICLYWSILSEVFKAPATMSFFFFFFFFSWKVLIFSVISPQHILWVLIKGSLNECPQRTFSWRNKKNINQDKPLIWSYFFLMWPMNQWRKNAVLRQHSPRALDKAFFTSEKYQFCSYFYTKQYVVGTHQKCLNEALLMSTHNIYFLWRI